MEETRYIEFKLSEQSYSISLSLIKEVIQKQKIIPLPKTPKYVLGIINLRGDIIPIIDMREKLGFNKGQSTEEAIVVLDLGHKKLGLVVDEVSKVININPENITKNPENNSIKDFYYSVYNNDGHVSYIIDVLKTFNQLDSVQKAA